ncbi:MAG TPA: hypothetical protein VJT31_15415 [Rugosimonospora sp.]|nr:hypothetical protein [Rugosimonospora sp.]
MTLPPDAFPADEIRADVEKTIQAVIEDLDAGGGNLVMDPWMLTEVVPKAMVRIIETHVPDGSGVCAACDRRPCPLRQTALAYTSGLVADGADFHTVVRAVAPVPPPPYGAHGSRRTGWLRRPPADGSTS